MSTYIAMDRGGLAELAVAAERGERPRHAMTDLAALVAARVVYPEAERSTWRDRFLARLIGTAEVWAFARRLRSTLKRGDVVYCINETIGFPVAALCGGRAGIVVLVHNIARPRASTALRLLGLGRRVATFLAVSPLQIDHLRRSGVSPDRLIYLSDQTDVRYFTPASDRMPLRRPMVMSVGLEQRDYRTLAAATASMDVDVRISGFSRDAVAVARAFPDAMPANMTRDFYDWPDLLELYRHATVVVVSLFPNRYAAGIQVMLEAISCGRPLVVTATEGLAGYLDRPDLITSVPPGDAAALRAAISAKIAEPDAAAAQAAAARDHYLPLIDSDRYNRTIAACLRRTAA